MSISKYVWFTHFAIWLNTSCVVKYHDMRALFLPGCRWWFYDEVYFFSRPRFYFLESHKVFLHHLLKWITQTILEFYEQHELCSADWRIIKIYGRYRIMSGNFGVSSINIRSMPVYIYINICHYPHQKEYNVTTVFEKTSAIALLFHKDSICFSVSAREQSVLQCAMNFSQRYDYST